MKCALSPPQLGGDTTGVLGDGVEDAVALAAGCIEIVGPQREAVAEPLTL